MIKHTKVEIRYFHSIMKLEELIEMQENIYHLRSTLLLCSPRWPRKDKEDMPESLKSASIAVLLIVLFCF